MRVSLIAIAILAHGMANAQTPDATEKPINIGPGMRPPSVLSMVTPDYTEEALKAKREGTVVFSIVVQKDGTPTDIRVIRPVGLGLDEKAIEALKKWRFKPGEKEGMIVSVRATIEVNFRLPGWQVRPLCLRPIGEPIGPTKVEDPPPVESPLPGMVTLSYEVDEQGTPKNVRVDTSSDPRLDAPAVTAASHWRFAPLRQGNQPVSFSCITKLEHR